jgi:hypothetical protein
MLRLLVTRTSKECAQALLPSSRSRPVSRADVELEEADDPTILEWAAAGNRIPAIPGER